MAETAALPKKKTSKPYKNRVKPLEDGQVEVVPKQISFFQRIAQIPAADWGTRAKVRVYRLEPLIDTVRSTGKKYITIYDDGPPDEERIKQDHGSGRYRLYFGMKSVGAALEREIDSVEIDILDPKFPPRLDLGDWLDDPKNRRWAWAKAILEAQASRTSQQQAPASSTLETLQVFNEIQDSVAARLEASKPPAAGDPVETAVKILNLTKGGGDSVLMQMFASQLDHAQKRSEKLEDELRNRNNPAPVAPVDPIMQLRTMAENLKSLKDLGLFGGGEAKESSAVESIRRSRMGPWMELFQPVLPEVVSLIKPFAAVVAQKMMQGKTQPTQQIPPQQPNVTQPPAAIQGPTQAASAGETPKPNEVPASQQELLDFVGQITPGMLSHFNQGLGGDVFASWIADGYSVERVQQVQMAPPEAMLEFFKHTPIWLQLRDREKAFLKFLQDFAGWKPEENEGDDMPSDGEGDEEKEIG